MNKKLILSLGMVAFSVLTFASCKAKHNHTFGDSFQHDSNQHWHVCEKDGCNEVSGKENHHGGTTTCTELAKCEDCGVSYGSTLSHSFTESKVDEKYLVSAADCDSSAVYYKSCVCGEKGTETFTSGNALGHSYATTYETDATHHWSVCTREGCTATSEKVAHSGGTATETAKAVCSTCGVSYGELATHQHDFSEEIEEATYLASAATCTEDAKYYYACAEEGCTSVGTTTWTKTGSALGHDTETKHDTTQHWEECVRENCDYSTTKENHKGGSATQTQQAVCSVCNTPYGELATHEHNHTKQVEDSAYLASAATCTEDAKYYYVCAEEGCTSVGTTTWTKTGSALGHAEANELSYKTDEAGHWKECSCGHVVVEKENHKDGEATCATYAKCSVCEESYGELSTEHVWGDWSSINLDGTKTRICTVDSTHKETESGFLGTENNPLTVSQVTAIMSGFANDAQSTVNAWVKGYVSSAKYTPYNGNDQWEYIIVDDLEDTTVSFKLYGCYTGGVYEGDFVVTGKLKKYSGSYQFNYGNTCEVITHNEYGVTLEIVDGQGDVTNNATVSTIPTRVNSGDTVSFTVTPVSGYDYMVKLNGSPEGITENNGTYSFAAGYKNVIKIVVVEEGTIAGATEVLKYTGTSTTNMNGEDQADLLNLDTNIFDVVGTAGTSSNNIGLNKDKTIRLYANYTDNHCITVTVVDGYVIDSIVFEMNEGTPTVLVYGNAVTPVNNVYSINAKTFSVVNRQSSGQVKIESISITYSTAEACGHDWDDIEWSFDEEKHWKKCLECNEVYGAGDHVEGIPATTESPAICGVCGNSYGEKIDLSEPTIVESLDGTKKSAGYNNYTGVWEYDNWTISAGANNNKGWDYFRLGGKKTNLNTLDDIHVRTNVAVSQATSKVEVVVTYLRPGTITNMVLTVASDKEFATVIDTVTLPVDGVKTYTFVPTSGSSWNANMYYKVEFIEDYDVVGDSNGLISIQYVNIYNYVGGDVEPECQHEGGEATCKELAVCTKCGESYGELNVNNHKGTAEWTKDADSHKKAYSCCNDIVVAEEAHEWENGVCKECEYVCTHTERTLQGKEATCTEKGLTEGKDCSVCETILVEQEEIPAKGHSYSTPDYDETNHWNECSCGAKENVEAHSHAYAYINDNGTLKYVGTCECGYKVSEEVEESEVEVSTSNDLIAVLSSGHNAKLGASIALDGAIVISNKVEVNLNNMSLTLTEKDTEGDGVFCVVENGHLTINGEGTVNGVGNNTYNIALYAKGGTIVINGGTYTNVGCQENDPGSDHFDLIYVKYGGHVEINGGTFINETPVWTLNSHDKEKGTFTVKGGKFLGYNPADNTTENPTQVWVEEGYCSVEVEGYYVVDSHVVVTDKAVEVTCTTDGYTEGSHCSRCNHVFVAQEKIDALGHDYNVDWSINEEEHWKECVNGCGTKNSLGAHVEGTPATTEHGAICSVCEQEYTDEINHTHSYDSMGYDETNHWNECSCEDKQNIETHTYTNTYVNDEGTLYYVKSCECGYKVSEEVEESEVEVSTANDLIAVLSSGHNAKLGASIALDGAIVISKKVEVNLNNMSLTLTEKDTEGDGVFCVVENGHLTINGEGTVNGVGNNTYNIALYAKGGTIVINGGTYTNVGCQENDPGSDHFDLIYVKYGGHVEINGGTFINETPVWTLNSHDKEKGTFTVKGGKFFGYNPADNTTENPTQVWVAEGYHAESVDDYYEVVVCEKGEAKLVSEGTKLYEVEACKCGYEFSRVEITEETVVASTDNDLREILKAGRNAVVESDLDLSTAVEVTKVVTVTVKENVTLSVKNDTEGNGVFHVLAGGELTLNGKGTINGLGNNPWSICIFADGGKVIIEEGNYTNVGSSSDFDSEHFDLIYVKNGGHVEIRGGTFECETPDWTLNSHDTKVGTIEVLGGSFKGFDPSDCKTEGTGTNWVKEGYCALEVESYYVVASHVVVTDEAVAANCTTTGLTEGFHCSRCNKILVAQEVVDALGHNYESVVTKPTCTTDGYTTHTCSVCNDSYTDTPVAATGHNMSEFSVTLDPTCAEAGEKTSTCANGCGHSVTASIDATGEHEYSINWTNSTDGKSHVKACVECGDVKESELHYGGTPTAQTQPKCVICSLSYGKKLIESASVSDITYNTASIGYSNGQAVETYTQSDIVFTFDKGTNSNAPKYYNTGTAIRMYGGNKLTISSTYVITKVTITYSSGDDGNNVTITGENTKEVIVSIDGDKGHRRVKAIEVTYTIVSYIEEGCSHTNIIENRENNDGLTHSKVCLSCNAVISTTTCSAINEANCIVNAVCSCGRVMEKAWGHDYSEWTTITPATCTEAELEGRRCSVCGNSQTQTGDAALGHDMHQKKDENQHWKECDRVGCEYVTTKEQHYGGTATEDAPANCEVCKEPYGDKATHTHTFTKENTEDMYAKTKVNCTTDGEYYYSCEECGASSKSTDQESTFIVDATGHTLETLEAVDPTCTATGLTEGKKCKTCGEVTVKQNIVNAKGHTYNGYQTSETQHWQVCTVCKVSTSKTSHYGGTATETEKAVCSVCSTSYGELASKKDVKVNIYANKGELATDKSSITWTDSGFTFTNYQANSDTAIRTSDTSHYRIYANSKFTIISTSGKKIVEIKVKCTSSTYATNMANSAKTAGYSASSSSTTATITNINDIEVIIEEMTAQSRIENITITYIG